MSEQILEVYVVCELYESWDGYYAHILPIVPRVKAKPFNVVSYYLNKLGNPMDKSRERNVIQSLSLLNLDYRDYIDPFCKCVYTVPTKIGYDVLISKNYVSDREAIKYLISTNQIRILKGVDWSEL